MDSHTTWQHTFELFSMKPIVVEPVDSSLTSDAGLLPIRQFDQAIGLTEAMAKALHDLRNPLSIQHDFSEMLRSRVFGILAGYEDQNDHDVLRSDPVFKLIAGRSPDANDLASQPTLSRFENAITVPMLRRLQDVFLDQFIASFAEAPTRLTFDIDTYDDPTHGQQQLTFFHAYYDQYQYQPRVITCAQNDQVVMLCLLFGSAHAALGAEDDIAYLVKRLREVWPDVDIELRADSGFAVPRMYEACEQLRIWYTIGLKMNPILKRKSKELLDEAVAGYDETAEPQRLFQAFWYQAASWPHPRFTIIKCEANEQGTNRRAVITNRLGAPILPEATYDEYADRGESENRNKELKCGLSADRLSDHRYMANLFRLYMHTAAHNLLVRLRQHIAQPPRPEPPTELPVAALAGSERKRYHNRRRAHDPLGEGHPCTWRSRLIKVAAEVVVTTRVIRIRLSSNWPFLEFFDHVCKAVTQPLLRPD